MVDVDPTWINKEPDPGTTPEYHAAELRRAEAVLMSGVGEADRVGARQGVRPGADAVSLAGTTITVHDVPVVVYPGVTSVSGPYRAALLQDTHELNAPDGTNPRKDIVVAQVQDHDEDSSGQRRARSFYVAGTPAVSPVEPALPSGSFRLATVTVPQSGGGGATLDYNAPFAVASGGVIPVRNDAELLGSAPGLYDGAVRWNRDTNALEVHNGSATWETVARANVPLVASGQASVTPDTVITTNYLGGGQTAYRGNTAIVFPVGRFTVEPFIVVAAETSVPGTLIEATFHSATSSGCTLSIARMTQTATNVNWIAMQP